MLFKFKKKISFFKSGFLLQPWLQVITLVKRNSRNIKITSGTYT